MKIRQYISSLPLLLLTTITQLTTPASANQQWNIQSGEWSYTALQSLIQTTNCTSGTPNRNLRNNQPLTRQEFATILSACQSQIQQHITSAPNNLATQQNQARLARLLKDFAPDLATLQEPNNSTNTAINPQPTLQEPERQVEPIPTNINIPSIPQKPPQIPVTSTPITPPPPRNLPPQINLAPIPIATSTDNSIEQVTNVSQLRDVQPNDWAYQALRNLVERYGCIAGYPDGTFRGNRAMTRYEFAAGLNACIQQIEKQFASGTANSTNQQDLVTLQRLTQEFQTELTALQGRFDALENRINDLAGNQFSTTAKLGGEVIFALSDAFGGDPPGTGDANATLNHLTRLVIVSDFAKHNRLRLELSAGNFTGFGFANPNILNTNTALLSFQQNSNNDIQLSGLEYRFPAFGDRVVFTVKPVGFSLSSVLTANSPFFDAGRGAISRFGEANPVFKIGNLDAGVGLDWLLGGRARLQLAYGARNANDPEDGAILGENAHAAGLQFLLLPTNNILTGLSFIYGYSPDGRLNTFTGSAIADASGFINQRSNIYAVSGTLQWRISPKVTFSTWGGLVGTYASQTDAFAVSTNYMFSLGFPDLFKEGNVLGILFGQPPKLVEVGNFSGSSGLGENANSFHVEAFYQFRINENISITPGVFWVTNPGNIEDNHDIFVGTLRTVFRF